MVSGSEIRDPERTYPGSRGQKGTGSATLDFRAPPTTKHREFKFLGETDAHKNVPHSIFSFYWHCLLIFFNKSV